MQGAAIYVQIIQQTSVCDLLYPREKDKKKLEKKEMEYSAEPIEGIAGRNNHFLTYATWAPKYLAPFRGSHFFLRL
jgi:hypothetical protein